MITLYNLANADQFFRIVDTCESPVFIRTQSGSTGDIRGNHVIHSLLLDSSGGKYISRLTLQTESSLDLQTLMHFAMQEHAKKEPIKTEHTKERAS